MLKEQNIAAFTEGFPFPACTVNAEGKVTGVSPRISEVFIYDSIEDTDIFILTGIRYKDLLSLDEREAPMIINRNEKYFRIAAGPVSEGDEGQLCVYFIDVTQQEIYRRKYDGEKTCLAIVNVDNFNELLNSNSEEKRSGLTSDIDKTIRQFFARNAASVTKIKGEQYLVVLESQYCDKMIETKFPLLDSIREIESESDFPVTISIGLGRGGKNLTQTEQLAIEALDLALGRGGDQVVLKSPEKIEYYGGKAQAVEKGNKGKARIVAHALIRLMDQASKVIVMGHANPDMDSFGSAIGVYRFAMQRGKEAHLVLNYYNETLTEIVNQAVSSELYDFIKTEKALALVNEKTLLVIVDTHRPSCVESPELLEKAKELGSDIAIIDHHRRAEDAIQGAALPYMESYASSASELIAEMLQYVTDKKNPITKFEAEAMLAGITVDTNSFAVKTGVRTFEAAAWLRRAGADTATVKRFFQMNSQAFMLRAKCVANARFLSDGAIAISVLEGKHVDAQILDSQAADELLDVRGVRASFVVGTTSKGRTVVSARSLGQINVQVIMEAMGGGGHLTTAGAQSDLPPEETVDRILEVLLEKGHITPADMGIEETMEEREIADAAKEEEAVIARGGESFIKMDAEQVEETLAEIQNEAGRENLIRKAAESAEAEEEK